MKKHLITFLTLLFALPAVLASNFTYHITQEQTVSEIQSGLQTAINNNEQVIVVGSKTNADKTLTLEIATGKKVVWQAVYQSIGSFSATALLSISGTGTFEVAGGTLITANAHAIHAIGAATIIVSGNGKVETSGDGKNAISTEGNIEIKDNAQISSTSGETVATFGDDATVTVTGGTITATEENAILSFGKNGKILISGGYMSSGAGDIYPTVTAHDPRPESEAFIHVSGNAIVEAKGTGLAINCSSKVKVSGNAQVYTSTGGPTYRTAIKAKSSVEVTDNAQVSVFLGIAISAPIVTVSGNSKIIAKENATAIYTFSDNDNPEEKVVIKDNAQVIAANGFAIRPASSLNFTLSLIGGVAFAYGNKISDVINYQQFLGPTGTGVVLAWDKQAGHTHYEKQSKEDIFVSPATATAHWDVIGGKAGIYYANGTNMGFIPLEVSVLSVSEPATAGFEVYPNPTSGELQVTSYK